MDEGFNLLTCFGIYSTSMKKWITILGIIIAILAVLVSSSLASSIDFTTVIVKLGQAFHPAVLTVLEWTHTDHVLVR